MLSRILLASSLPGTEICKVRSHQEIVFCSSMSEVPELLRARQFDALILDVQGDLLAGQSAESVLDLFADPDLPSVLIVKNRCKLQEAIDSVGVRETSLEELSREVCETIENGTRRLGHC